LPIEVPKNISNEEEILAKLNFSVIKLVSEEISKQFNISIFGFDILISDNNIDWYIIDLNYFPSF